MANFRTRARSYLARHLYSYLAAIVAIVAVITVTVARDDFLGAFSAVDLRLLALALGLTLVNYGLRFVKWQQMLNAVGRPIPLASSARIFFACLSMVVTPFRLGEVYKLVFLKRIHGAELRRTAPVLVMERITDIVAILALAALWFDRHQRVPFLSALILAGAVVVGYAVGKPRWRTVI